jgi:hypothetical protein
VEGKFFEGHKTQVSGREEEEADAHLHTVFRPSILPHTKHTENDDITLQFTISRRSDDLLEVTNARPGLQWCPSKRETMLFWHGASGHGQRDINGF